jgi:hypothetical protein
MQGVEFEKHDVEITDDFRKMYNEAVDLWAAIDVAFVGAREDGALEGRGFKSVRTQQFGARPLVRLTGGGASANACLPPACQVVIWVEHQQLCC